MTPADVKEKIDNGANLTQVYTGFIYLGPWMVKKWVSI
jgi:dihydroorotate dehydrogenase